MIQERMILLEDPLQLTSVFQHLTSRPNKVLIWQNIQGKGKRVCQSARIGAINLSQEEMALYPKNGEFLFHHHSYLYFFGFNRTTIFKAPILYHSRLKLVLRLPKQLMLANSRNEVREDLSLSHKFVFYTHNSFTDQPYISSKLLDLSPKGLAFRSSLHNVVRFKKGDRLWIRSPFTGRELLEGEVSNVTKVSESISHQNFWRIGVKL
ncbi:hypothetical protein ACJVC5_02360 [Peredibacter sp. HCB2-198]|uniref:hypothetical protein n=1 Tax=Peredibacter sp. HCB2-198 TaxID=3383025 RepID=UPI0038B5E2A9